MSRFVSLAGEQVAELADRSAEPGRLSRGRALFRKGSVSDLSIVEGSVIASVRGSEGDDYETTIGTALAPPGVLREVAQAQDPESHRSIEDLIGDGVDVCPRDMDLAFACDCADWDEPCKHVVAVLLAFADRVDLDGAELLRWRGIDLSPASTGRPVTREVKRERTRPATPSRPKAASQARPTPTADPEPELPTRSQVWSPGAADGPDDRTAKLSELEALLGDTVLRVPTAEDEDQESSSAELEPALAEFLGVGMTIEPIDLSNIAAPAPLFADVQLGPLADLGPELAKALAAIIARLEDVS